MVYPSERSFILSLNTFWYPVHMLSDVHSWIPFFSFLTWCLMIRVFDLWYASVPSLSDIMVVSNLGRHWGGLFISMERRRVRAPFTHNYRVLPRKNSINFLYSFIAYLLSSYIPKTEKKEREKTNSCVSSNTKKRITKRRFPTGVRFELTPPKRFDAQEELALMY